MANHNSNTYKYNRLRKALQLSAIFFISVFLTSLQACKKDGDLRPNLADQGANSIFTDSTTVLSTTQRGDSILTTNTTYNLAGRLNDPVFGITDAGVYFQLDLNGSDVDFGDEANLIVDSIILTLDYQNIYGHENDQQTFTVYELSEGLDGEKSYYSDTKLSVNSTAIGNHSFTPNLSDSVLVDSLNYPPHLRIPLSNAFGQKILNASGTSDLSDNTNFRDFIKGLYVLPDTTSSPAQDEGALITFDLLSNVSQLTLYYSNTSTSVSNHYDFEINNNTVRVNTFDHNYSGTTVAQSIINSMNSTKGSYVQSAAGVKTKFSFPFIKNYTDQRNIAISKAELVIPIDENYDASYPPPENMVLVGINEEGESVFLPDNFEGEGHFGGNLDKTTNRYTFNITRHIHNIINEGKADYGLYLLPAGSAIQGNRAKINSPLDANNPIKLNLTYTR